MKHARADADNETAFTLDTFLPYLLTVAAEQSGATLLRRYQKELGLSRAEWRVMAHLGEAGELPAVELSKRSWQNKTSVSRAVQKLDERGLLRRRESTIDRRLEHLSLTASGQRLHARLAAIASDYEKALTARFTEEEITVLRHCLKRLQQDG